MSVLAGIYLGWPCRHVKDQARIPCLRNEMRTAVREVAAKLASSSTPSFARSRSHIFESPERLSSGAERTRSFSTDTQNYPFNSNTMPFSRRARVGGPEERVSRCSRSGEGNWRGAACGIRRAGQPPVFTDYDFLDVGVPRTRVLRQTPIQPTLTRIVWPGAARSRVSREYSLLPTPTCEPSRCRTAFFHNGVFNSWGCSALLIVERDIQSEVVLSNTEAQSISLTTSHRRMQQIDRTPRSCCRRLTGAH